MKYFRFWAKEKIDGPEFPVTCWGGSNKSVADAQATALDRAKRAIEILKGTLKRENEEYYLDQPAREEIIEEIKMGDDVVGLITRNANGSLVLNTDKVMFVDIDYEPLGLIASIRRAIRAFFGDSTDLQDAEILKRIDDTLNADKALKAKIYRTRNGYRLIMTNKLYDPNSDESSELLDRFGSDRLYKRLCRRQECYRARLSPKSFRIGAGRPPVRFPFEGEQVAQYQTWLADYEKKARGFTTCQIVNKQLGGHVKADAIIARIVEIHDHQSINRHSHVLA